MTVLDEYVDVAIRELPAREEAVNKTLNTLTFPFRKIKEFYSGEEGLGRIAYTVGKLTAVAGTVLTYAATKFSQASNQWFECTYKAPKPPQQGLFGFFSNLANKVETACKDPIIDNIEKTTDLSNYSQFFDNLYLHVVEGNNDIELTGRLGYFISENFSDEKINSMFNYAQTSYGIATILMMAGISYVAFKSEKK